MGWHHVPDLDSNTATADDNPFAGPKVQTPGKVLVNLPIDEWLCKKMSKLNLTLVQGYPTRTSEAGGLLRDQFVRPARSTGKWYGLHTDPKKDSSDTVSSWNTNSSRLNSTYLKFPDKPALLPTHHYLALFLRRAYESGKSRPVNLQ